MLGRREKSEKPGFISRFLTAFRSAAGENEPSDAALPADVADALRQVDWSARDVLVGTLRHRAQLEACLRHRFYHIPAAQFTDADFPIHWVAIYQSKHLFGSHAGVQYYGAVTRCTRLPRREIRELPRDSDEPYYRFEVEEWKKLARPIAAKELGFIKHQTNRFLLEHSAEVPELFITSAAEYRFCAALRSAIHDVRMNTAPQTLGFAFGPYRIDFEDGDFCLSRGPARLLQYEIARFTRNPHALFGQIEQDLQKLHQPALSSIQDR